MIEKQSITHTQTAADNGKPELSLEELNRAASDIEESPEFKEALEAQQEADRIEAQIPADDSLARVLDDIERFTRRFLVTGDAEHALLALWVAHTYALDLGHFDYTPYLTVEAPEKNAGKTMVLRVLALLVPRAENWDAPPTAAVLYRLIEQEHPTVLMDEMDTLWAGRDEDSSTVRGVLNSGFQRGGKVARCVTVGKKQKVERFETFGPKALAGIGRAPDTITNRSIPIVMQKCKPGEQPEKLRPRQPEIAEAAEVLKARVTSAVEKAEFVPVSLEQLDGREMDITEPLVTVAAEAGGDWPERCRTALTQLLKARERGEPVSLERQLLSDTRRVFASVENPERVSSSDLVARLVEIKDSPWPTSGKRGEPLNQYQLATMLKQYGIAPKVLRIDDFRGRGYEREAFEREWQTWLPTEIESLPARGDGVPVA